MLHNNNVVVFSSTEDSPGILLLKELRKVAFKEDK